MTQDLSTVLSFRTADRGSAAAWLGVILVAFLAAGCTDLGPLHETPTDPFGGIHGQ